MSIFFSDIIRTVAGSTDEYGVKTEIESDDIKCKFYEKNEIIANKIGKEVIADAIVLLDKDAIVKYGDKVILKQKSGIDYIQPNKEFIIAKITLANGFSMHHKVVYLEDV